MSATDPYWLRCISDGYPGPGLLRRTPPELTGALQGWIIRNTERFGSSDSARHALAEYMRKAEPDDHRISPETARHWRQLADVVAEGGEQ